MSKKRFIVGTLLLLLPFLAVNAVKQTKWGPILATPAVRQIGDSGAKVIIVEFSDFQCPMCARVEPAIHQFLDMYKGKIRFIYKYYPLVKVHLNAMSAARAADCAADQKKFWPYHDRLFETQESWAKLGDPSEAYTALAREMSLDMTKFNACRQDSTRTLSIEQDAREAVTRQVSATPTFFIGDERLVGMDFVADGARAIEKALRQ